MNLGAGQPATLPYGVEPQSWYSYHSLQFSSPLLQSPFPSVCYHPPPGNHPPPHQYYPPPQYSSIPPRPPDINHLERPPAADQPWFSNQYHSVQYSSPPPQQWCGPPTATTDKMQGASFDPWQPLTWAAVRDGYLYQDQQPSSPPPSTLPVGQQHHHHFHQGVWYSDPQGYCQPPPSEQSPHPPHYYPPSHSQQIHPIISQPPTTIPQSPSNPNNYHSPPPSPNPYSHFIPTNQIEPPPNPQLCSVPPQLDRVRDPEYPIVGSSDSSFQFSDARVDEFIESVSRLIDNCISKCMKGIRQVSEGSSPSVSTQTSKLQSSEPKVCSPLRLQPVTKSSSLLCDAHSATGGVKKRRYWKRKKLLMSNKSLLTSSMVPSLLDNTILAQSNISASSCFVSGIGFTVPNFNCVDNGCDAIDFVFGDKFTGIDVTCDNEKRKNSDMKVRRQNGDGNEFSKLKGDNVKDDEHAPNSYVKGREFCALHLLAEMSKPKELCSVGRTVAGTTIRDKGGGLVHLAIAVNNEEEDDVEYVQNHSAPNIDISLGNLAGNSNHSNFGQLPATQGITAAQHLVPATSPIGMLQTMHQMSIGCGGTTPSLQYGIPSLHDMTLNRSTSHSQLSTRAVAASTRKNGSVVSKMVIKGALCKRLKHHTEGTRKISHCAMLLCFLGFDKKIRDKGSGDPLIMDEHVVIGNEFEGNIKLLLVCMSNFITAIVNSEKRALEVIASRWVFESYLISIDHEAKVRGGMDTLLGVITDGTYVLLLTKDICSDGWMELVVLKHVQSGLMIALFMVRDDLNVTDDATTRSPYFYKYKSSDGVFLINQYPSKWLSVLQVSRILSCSEISTPATFLWVLTSSLKKFCSGCMKYGVLDQSCRKFGLRNDQFRTFAWSKLELCKLSDLLIICVQELVLLAIVLQAFGSLLNYNCDAWKISFENTLACKCLSGLQSSTMALLICWYGYSKIVLDNGTTYAAFLCICWITCASLSEQLHNYHKALGEPADVIDLERCHGYFVLLGIAACLDSNIIYDGEFDYNTVCYNDWRRGKTTAFSVYMEPGHADIYDNDRNRGVMVDNEDVRAAVIDLLAILSIQVVIIILEDKVQSLMNLTLKLEDKFLFKGEGMLRVNSILGETQCLVARCATRSKLTSKPIVVI